MLFCIFSHVCCCLFFFLSSLFLAFTSHEGTRCLEEGGIYIWQYICIVGLLRVVSCAYTHSTSVSVYLYYIIYKWTTVPDTVSLSLSYMYRITLIFLVYVSYCVSSYSMCYGILYFILIYVLYLHGYVGAFLLHWFMCTDVEEGTLCTRGYVRKCYYLHMCVRVCIYVCLCA